MLVAGDHPARLAREAVRVGSQEKPSRSQREDLAFLAVAQDNRLHTSQQVGQNEEPAFA